MTKLFVGQVSKSMSEDQLLPLFQEYGNIVELAVIRDKITGAHKGMLQTNLQTNLHTYIQYVQYIQYIQYYLIQLIYTI